MNKTNPKNYLIALCLLVAACTSVWVLLPREKESGEPPVASSPSGNIQNKGTTTDSTSSVAADAKTGTAAAGVASQAQVPAALPGKPAGDPVFGLIETADGLQASWVRPRRTLDTTHNYVIIEGAKAHPTRLLAKFSKSAEIDKAKPALLESRYEPYRTPLNRGGLVVLESSMAENTQVTSDEEASANGLALAKRMDALRASGQFEYVEPDYIVSIDAVPTDSALTDGTLWGLKNTGQNGGTSGVDVDAERAWDITTGSDDVVVGVVDTGIRYTHQDLAANMWINPGESGGGKETNGIDDDGNGYIDDVHGINAITGSGNPMDDNNHGSHCAGTIGAQSDGGGPHVGVAWQVRLMALKFLNASNQGLGSDAIECIEYAIDKKAKILSNSWGGGGFSEALFQIIRNASASQIMFVAAAGNYKSNNDTTAHYPSSYRVDNMVSVAAIDRAGALASFSNYGAKTVHLGAPGVEIFSSTASADNAYASYRGTSMATPHVSGVAALLAARYPSESMLALRDRLIAGAQPTASLAGKVTTGGWVNAYNSLTVAVDGNLEVNVIPEAEPLVGGELTRFEVIVSDLEKVTGAVVRARNEALGIDVSFKDDGGESGGPDSVANDGIYTAKIPLPEASSLASVGGTGSLALEFSVTATGKTNYLKTKTFKFLELATNNSFSNAITITGETITTPAIGNIVATKEPGEPDHAGNSGGKSLWWKWTAPRTGWVQLDTQESSFDTLLAVYTGASVDGLTEVSSNDDLEYSLESSTFQFKSKLVFDAVQGETYYIAVDGCRIYDYNNRYNYFTSSGNAILKLLLNTPPVANDANFVVEDGVAANLSLVATDADSQKLDYFISQAPANGNVTFSNLVDGAFSYTPKPGFRGVDTFRYYVTDGIENSTTKLVSITVNAGQDSDGDSIPDAWEIANGLNPAANDAGLDADSDGLTNFQEYMGSVDPRNAASGPMKIAIEPANASFKASSNWSTSGGGNSFRNGLSNERGPTSPTLAWRAGRNASYGSSTFIEGNTVVTTRFYPSNATDEATQQGGAIVAHRLDTGALLWEKQLPLDFPNSDSYSCVIGVHDGRVYASRRSDFSPSYIYALRLSDGLQLWRSAEVFMVAIPNGESDDVSPVYAPNGDLIVTWVIQSYRINCLTGETVWKSETYKNLFGLYSVEAVNGDRLYGQQVMLGQRCIAAVDPDTGKVKYSSPMLSAKSDYADKGFLDPRMFIGPDGTVYVPIISTHPKTKNFRFLYAFEDTGTSFRLKWQSPPFNQLNYATFAVGPDGSVYSYDSDYRVVRLHPEDGKVLNTSISLSKQFGYVKRMVVDSTGLLYLSDGTGPLYCFNADLTQRWTTSVPNIYLGGPTLGSGGTLVVSGGGENGIYAFRVPEDQQPPAPVITPMMSIIYTGNILEQADSPGGPWTVIPNATSPWTVPVNARMRFYRVRLY